MPSLVITQDCVNLSIHSQHLEMSRREESDMFNRVQRIKVPLIDIDRVIICGRPAVTMPVLQKLMKKGIPTFFVSSHHRWIGSLLPDNNMNAERRIRQYELARDEEFALAVAQKLIFAKLRNSRRVLQRLAVSRHLTQNRKHIETMRQLKDIAEKTLQAEGLEELRGYEGLGAAIYFSQLGNFFPDNVPFSQRSRRPPRDAANALLSWTYSILLGEIDAAVRARGLDACIGYLHAISHGTPALSLDLLEPLRAPCCDLLVLNILNHRYLTEEDFEYHDSDGGTYLKPAARAPFFQNYELAMTRKFTPFGGGNHVDFRKVIEQSIEVILKAMAGDMELDFFMMP